MECDKPLALTEFDITTLSETTQMMKALVPFLSISTTKTISIAIRFYELIQTIEYFKNPIHTQSGNSFNRSNFTIKEIINEAMPYIPGSSADTIKMIQNFIDMFGVFNMYKDMEQSQDFQSIINMVSNMYSNDTFDVFKNMGMGFNNSAPSETNSSIENNSNKSSNPVDLLSGVMSVEQQDLYNKYMEDIDNNPNIKL